MHSAVIEPHNDVAFHVNDDPVAPELIKRNEFGALSNHVLICKPQNAIIKLFVHDKRFTLGTKGSRTSHSGVLRVHRLDMLTHSFHRKASTISSSSMQARRVAQRPGLCPEELAVYNVPAIWHAGLEVGCKGMIACAWCPKRVHLWLGIAALAREHVSYVIRC